MSEIMDQLIEDSKIKSLVIMMQDGTSEEKACGYLQIPEKMRAQLLAKARMMGPK